MKPVFYKFIQLASAVVLCVATQADAGTGPDMVKAQSLLDAGKAAAAYALLAPAEFEMSGDAKYDYLLGVAALDSGKPDMATLALERVLAVNPNFAGARIDLSRAYFALGDYLRAKTGFEEAMEQNPPPVAKIVIEKYLAAIDDKLNPKTSVSGYLEGALGYDTNVNASTNASQVFVPLFGTLMTLSEGGVAARDNYLTLGGGFEVAQPLKKGLSAFIGLDGKKRVNFFKDTFNNDSVDGHAGLSIGEGEDVVRVMATKGIFYLDDKFNRDSAGYSAEWRHTLDPRNMVSTFGQYSMLSYGHDKTSADLSANDINLSVGGVGWLHSFDDQGKNIAFVSIYGGDEAVAAVGAPRLDGGQRFAGIKLGGQKWLNDKLDFFASLGAKEGNYLAVNPLILTFRRDYQYDLNFGLNWKPMQNWIVRPQLTYTRNDSNSGLNDYDRKDLSVSVRREFR